MKLRLCEGGGFASNCYLLLDDSDREAIAVDPSVPYREAKAMLGAAQIKAILLTHAHADHLLFLNEWKTESGAPVLIGEGDAEALRDPERNCSLFLGLGAMRYGMADHLLSEGEMLSLGDESLTVLSTPGHSPGSICLLCGDRLISGDTLFGYGGVGRTDFIGGSSELLARSLRRILALSGETTVYPGHGRETTVAAERRYHLRLLSQPI